MCSLDQGATWDDGLTKEPGTDMTGTEHSRAGGWGQEHP